MVLRKAWLVLAATMCAACGQLPDGVQPVTGFDAERYLGTWYEVARLDHSFERGITRVTATCAARARELGFDTSGLIHVSPQP